MNFRDIRYDEDIEEIVNLVKNGLDPSFTDEFFRWKHLSNPFGNSFGLVAEDEGRIIGLRMFMFWEFFNNKEAKILKAIRPVDTVVSKDYRGRGLFKHLTLEGLGRCKGSYDLIFNTPNENSLPGYLKMGWDISEDVPNLKLGLINFFNKKHNIKILRVDSISFSKKEIFYNKGWCTNKSEEFIKWRYSNSDYIAARFEDNFLIFSIIFVRNIKTIIVYELLGDTKFFQGMLVNLTMKMKTPFIYFLDNQEFNNIHFITSIKRKNPIITFKNDENIIKGNLNFSLGDLEGKL